MIKEQKYLLIVSSVLFILIPVYGLSHSLSTYNPQTRLNPGLVFALEILVLIITYILYNLFSKKPFVSLKKFLKNTVPFIAIGILVFLFYLAYSSQQHQGSGVTNSDVVTFPIETLEIISNESLNSNYPIYRIVIKNNSTIYTATNIKLRFTFSKTKGGEVLDTREASINDTIQPGETKTESVTVNTPFDTTNQYWWTVQIIGAENL